MNTRVSVKTVKKSHNTPQFDRYDYPEKRLQNLFWRRIVHIFEVFHLPQTPRRRRKMRPCNVSVPCGGGAAGAGGRGGQGGSGGGLKGRGRGDSGGGGGGSAYGTCARPLSTMASVAVTDADRERATGGARGRLRVG